MTRTNEQVVPSAQFMFPKDFLWGTSVSAYQLEGKNYNSTWFDWKKAAEKVKVNDNTVDGCGWLQGRWREDIERAANFGQNSMRISVEWSRIQPESQRFDENAIEYYREIVRGMITRGLRPIVTLHHFSDPIWFELIGGWENPQSPQLFMDYAQKIIPALAPLLNDWVIINEPNTYVFNSYLRGIFPPGKKNDRQAVFFCDV